MQYIEAPDTRDPLFPTVFLAGGITGCPDWQRELTGMLSGVPVTVYNPRRAQWDMKTCNMQEQVVWEHRRLHNADVLAFWFSEGSLNPIALLELGAALERQQPLIVGCSSGYLRIPDVLIQTRLQRGIEFTVYWDLPDMASAIIGQIST